ncbi:MAG TPA: hypothetical protein PKA20_14805 [Burkholderiaceae bacterium]|nr:hypothetical protein [Burkholderiaceae bacterium]
MIDQPATDIPSYQDLLDEALMETFPASDPIAAGGAIERTRPVDGGRNEKDWRTWPVEAGAATD